MCEHKADSPKGGVKMNKYETIIIINPTLDEAATKAVVDKSIYTQNFDVVIFV